MKDLIDKAKVLHHQGQFYAAEGLYEQAISSDDSNSEAFFLLGTLLAERGENTRAEKLLENAIQIEPKNSMYHSNIGVVQHKLDKLDQAKISLLLAIELDHNNTDAKYNLAKLYKESGLIDAAENLYREILTKRKKTDYWKSDQFKASVLMNLGNILFDKGQVDDSINLLENAKKMAPSYPQPIINLANAFRRIGNPEKAISNYQLALKIDSHDGLSIKSLLTLPIIYNDQEHIDYTREKLIGNVNNFLDRELGVTDPSLETTTTNFFLAYQNLNDKELQRAIAQIHLNSCPRLGWVAPHCSSNKKTKGRIKLGFISSYFRLHSIGKLMVGLIQNIPKDTFEITIITIKGQSDPIAQSIEKMADNIIYFSENFFDIHEDIGHVELDVLVYAEIGMDIRTYFLAFARLAPIQCVLWGHPDTTGIPNIDTFFSSSLIETVDAQEHYSENLVLFSDLPTYMFRPTLLDSVKTREDFGFGRQECAYLCCQSLFKYHPDIDELFGGILEGNKNSKIFIVEGAVNNWKNLLRRRFIRNIGDLANRIIFVPRQLPENFLALQNAADVILDTPHFSGGITSYEALSLGKPVITLDSKYMRGRVSAGMYRSMEMDDCTANSFQEYIDLAVTLGSSKDLRQAIESKIKERNDYLFEVTRFVDDFVQYLEKLLVSDKI